MASSSRPARRTVKRPGFDLLNVPVLGRFLRWKHARSAMQIPLFLIAVLMIWDGLTGNQLAPRNTATVLAWVHYRGFVVLALLIAGNMFCMACPFMLPRNALRRFITPTRRWPKVLRNKWLAAALLAAFFFAYELFDLWASPWWTAWIILGYFGLALLIDSVFMGASFCKYVCPLGQFNMVGSLISPLEVKVREPQRCATCHTKDCIKGNEFQHGCELWLFQERKVGNLDCTFCLDCVHACPHDNVGIRLHPVGRDLAADERRSGIGVLAQRPDVSVLLLVLTFGALLNAFGMVSPVYAFEQWLAETLGLNSQAAILGLIFGLGLVLEPLVLIGGAAWLSRWLTRQSTSLWELINRYTLGLAPLGFAVWLAHYLFHFLTGFWTFGPALQIALHDLGLPAAWLQGSGTGSLLNPALIEPLQLLLISLGAGVSLWACWRTSQRIAPKRALEALVPWAAVILVMTYAAFWLMQQPMEMRGTMTLLGG